MARVMAHGAILVFLVTVTSVRPAYAYIDPGTATIALQAIIGAIAAAGFYFRSAITKTLRLLRPGAPENDNKRNPDPPSRP